MKQYNMTGSEKADGYSQDAFIGLTEEEKLVVFDLLKSELPWSIKWLFVVDKAKAILVAKEMEKKERQDPYGDAYMLQQKLLKYTGDLSYQAHMIEDYPKYVDSKKPLVVDAVDRTPQNAATVDFYKRVILTEVNDSAVAGASIYLLDALSISRDTDQDKQNYNRLRDKLRSDNLNEKLRALEQIGVP